MEGQRQVIIIHSSAVIRKGLRAILGELTDTRFFMFSSPVEIEAFEPGDANEYLFVVDEAMLDKLIIQYGEDIRRRVLTYGNGEEENSLHDGLSEEEVLERVNLHFKDHDPADGSEEVTLSKREQEILRNVAMGHSNKEIADKLFISTHTVISHRKNITEKLGIRSISGLTLYAILNKIIDPDQLTRTDLI